MYQILSLITTAFFISACSDNASVVVFDKNITQTEISCMQLRVWPPDATIEKYLQRQYSFDGNCSYLLEVSTKNGITCNSNQNVQTKALGTFPTSYIKMEILREKTLAYSYYKDLQGDVELSDVKRACDRMGEDLLFFSK
ncbi:MAG: hypothetical protein PHW94_08595 [Sulfurimonas sp.]|nr:hypothetical protein [Sulfurimonas sp.]MDD3060979.1 hypothetical protein [Sulfurimonas sp.]